MVLISALQFVQDIVTESDQFRFVLISLCCSEDIVESACLIAWSVESCMSVYNSETHCSLRLAWTGLVASHRSLQLNCTA